MNKNGYEIVGINVEKIQDAGKGRLVTWERGRLHEAVPLKVGVRSPRGNPARWNRASNETAWRSPRLARRRLEVVKSFHKLLLRREGELRPKLHNQSGSISWPRRQHDDSNDTILQPIIKCSTFPTWETGLRFNPCFSPSFIFRGIRPARYGR